MSTIIADLTEEHNAIQLMLKILDEIASDFEENKEVPEEHLEGLVEFFTVFADKCHHGKEENLLFPALVEKGVNLEEEPFNSILDDHKVGKTYISNMLGSIKTYRGSETDMKIFVENARSYINLLSDHIDLENDELFGLTEKYLNEQEQASLKNKFDEFEEDVIGDGVHDRLHVMIDDLRDYYL